MSPLSQKVQFVICPGLYPEAQHEGLYENIFGCWNDVWSSTFQELENNGNYKSDNFTRQDLIGAVLIDGQCKAMSVFRFMKGTSRTLQLDSYFDNWGDLHRRKLTERGSHILVCSHFTIHPSARKELTGFSMRDLLMGMTTEVFLNSKANAMTGAMRKNRNVHLVAYEWGAIPVGQDVPSGLGDALVDLVAFFKKEVAYQRTHEMVPWVNELWQNRLVIAYEPLMTANDFAGSRPLKIKSAA